MSTPPPPHSVPSPLATDLLERFTQLTEPAPPPIPVVFTEEDATQDPDPLDCLNDVVTIVWQRPRASARRPLLRPNEDTKRNTTASAMARLEGRIMSIKKHGGAGQLPSAAWLALLAFATLALTDVAMAQRQALDLSCESECHTKARSHNETCDEDDCEVSRGEMLSVCRATCQPQPAPTDAELEAIAEVKATALTGMPVELYETVDYVTPAGQPRTRRFLFTTDRLPRRAVLLNLLSRRNVRAIVNTRMVTVEVGVNQSLPPIVGYWRGLPLDFEVEQRARRKMAQTRSAVNPRLIRRLGSAITPVLEFEDDEGRIAVDGRNLLVVRDPQFRVIPQRVAQSPSLQTRQAWRNQLNAVRR